MNCPTCGAQNEADAHFCAECGAPLEKQDDASVANEDMTIMSTFSEISEEAKTVSVSQEDVAGLAAAMAQAEEAEFEPETPAPRPLTGQVITDNSAKNNTQRYIVIGILVFLVLCCCCCVLASLVSAVAGEMDIDNIDFSYHLFSVVEPVV
jgi:hypothetical protein